MKWVESKRKVQCEMIYMYNSTITSRPDLVVLGCLVPCVSRLELVLSLGADVSCWGQESNLTIGP